MPERVRSASGPGFGGPGLSVFIAWRYFRIPSALMIVR